MLLKAVDVTITVIIWLPITTIVVMIWQQLREDPKIVVLPNITIRGTAKGAGTHAFQRPVKSAEAHPFFIHWAIRRPKLNIVEFKPMERYVASFDIGNVGFHDITVHEGFVEKEEAAPPKEVKGPIIWFQDRGQRKILHCKERTTGEFELEIEDNRLTVFRIDIRSVGLEAFRRVYVFKRADRLLYFDAARRIGLNREKIEKSLRKIMEQLIKI